MVMDEIDTSITYLQAEVLSFRCRIFHCFAYYHWILSFINYPLFMSLSMSLSLSMSCI